MNPFMLSAQSRLVEWRTLRNEVSELSEQEQLARVAAWVAQAPTSTYVLDYDDPKTWPSPWVLLSDNDYDDVALAYLMEQTLIMMGWDPARLTLRMVRNSKEHQQMMVLIVDDQWVLNYAHAEVVNFDKHRSDCTYLVSYRVVPGGRHEEV